MISDAKDIDIDSLGEEGFAGMSDFAEKLTLFKGGFM